MFYFAQTLRTLFNFVLRERWYFYFSRIVVKINILHEHFDNIHTDFLSFSLHVRDAPLDFKRRSRKFL